MRLARHYCEWVALRHSLRIGFWSWVCSWVGGYSLLLQWFRYRFRPYGGSLLANAPEVTKRSCPLHPARLRRLDSLRSPCGPAFGCYCASLRFLAPSLFQGPAYKDRPWTFTPLAASMRLAPFHNDSTRPSDGAFGVACDNAEQAVGAAHGRDVFTFCLCRPQIAQSTRSPNPVRRPSGGAVERGVWHGCQTRNDGPGMAHRDDPRNSTGAREVERSETRMPGALSLWLLSLSREQRESDSA